MSQLKIDDDLIFDSDYSTSEKKTGATWTDGKPIYRVSVSGNVTPTVYANRAGAKLEKVINNLDTLVNAYGFGKFNGGTYNKRRFSINGYLVNTDLTFLVGGAFRLADDGKTVDGTIFIKDGTLTPTSVDMVMTIEYTKTTD